MLDSLRTSRAAAKLNQVHTIHGGHRVLDAPIPPSLLAGQLIWVVKQTQDLIETHRLDHTNRVLSVPQKHHLPVNHTESGCLCGLPAGTQAS